MPEYFRQTGGGETDGRNCYIEKWHYAYKAINSVSRPHFLSKLGRSGAPKSQFCLHPRFPRGNSAT